MEIIRQGEQFYKIFELQHATFNSLRQIIIKCYSDVNPEDNIVFLKALRPEQFPKGINLEISEEAENRIKCFFSKEFTQTMTPGLWKVEAVLKEEAGYDGDIYKPLGNLFNVLPTTITNDI